MTNNKEKRKLFIREPLKKKRDSRCPGNTWVIKEEKEVNGKIVNVRVRKVEINQINKDFLEKKISYKKAKELVEQLVAKILDPESFKTEKPKEDYDDPDFYKWKDWMGGRKLRETTSIKTLKYYQLDMLKVLKRVNKTVHTITPTELRDGIQEVTTSEASQRKIVTYFNSCFKYIKRDLVIDRKQIKSDKPVFNYIRSAELKQFLRGAPPKLLHPVRILFFTGIRVGELYGLEKEDWKGRTLWIDRQKRKDKVVRSPKNDKKRTTVAPDCIIDDLNWWFNSSTVKNERTSLSEMIHAHCDKTRVKHFRIHDLRHSFAMYCLQEKKIGISIIARLLGDTVSVCEAYYIGSRMSDEVVGQIADSF